MKLTCEDCGKEVDYALVNGYYFGDRQLEGMWFRIKVVSDNPVTLVGKYDGGMDNPYVKGLNMKMWNEEAAIFAIHADIWTCPECEGDIMNPFFEVPTPVKKTVV